MPIYFAGLTSSILFENRRNNGNQSIVPFSEIIQHEFTDIEIGCCYLLLWQSERLFISYDPDKLFGDTYMAVELPNPSTDGYCKLVVPHHQREILSILSTNNVLWEYEIYRDVWKMINVFKPNRNEHAVKIIHCGCNILLTNLGRLLIMDDQLEITKEDVKFIDVVHGVKHVILLGDDSNIYEIIIEMLQLENGDTVPDYIIGPDIIPVLLQPRFVQIAAGAEHYAAITEEGHLHTWGCNTNGELGLTNIENTLALPQLVTFRRYGRNVDVKIKKVECGSNFTICLADDGSLWGTGDNSYGQFGKAVKDNISYPRFMKLNMEPLDGKTVKDIKCNEQGTAIITE